MDILKGHSATVKFVVPDSLVSANYQVFKNDIQIGTTSLAVVSGGTAACDIPYAAVQEEGQVKVTLTFVYQTVTYTPSKTFNVVTPYLDLYEIKDVLQTTDDALARKTETSVRNIINSHCGQTFGHSTETIYVKGRGFKTLELPKRLMTLTSVNDSTATEYFNIAGDGYWLELYPLGVPPVKADYYGLHIHVGGVIHNPYGVDYGKFRDNVGYMIAGEWGWENVPEEVKEAARILVETYSDPDSEYRDRYLTSMTAADWRIQFQDGAFINTGNVRADQLLAGYTMRRGWVVL